MRSSTARVSLQVLLLTLIVVSGSEVQRLTITIDKGTTVNIKSSAQAKNCNVCTGVRLFQHCARARQFKDKTPVSVDLQCPRRQDIVRGFIVEIVQNIECSTISCNGHIIQTDSSFLPLLDFNRTFTWNLTASAPRAFKIDFTRTGLRQIHPSEKCPDGHSYTLQAFETTETVTIGKYCRAGIISNAQILNRGSFSVVVPAGQKLQNGQFDVSVGEEIKSLAKITLSFPKGTSSSELFSPNYPGSFPDDDEMEWFFQVPDKHKTSVQFLNVTQPHCLKKSAEMEYRSKGRAAWVESLTDHQLDHMQGNVSLKLRNCQTDRKRSGLSVNLKVSVSNPPAMLAIILSVVTAALVIVLVVACLVIKKKKKKQNNQTSIYNPNFITSLPPGHSSFTKTSTEEYHVYETVDETQIYSHLLKDDAEVDAYRESDADRPVSRHTDLQKPQITNDTTADYIEVIGGN